MDRRNFLKFCAKGLVVAGATVVGLNKLENNRHSPTENIGYSPIQKLGYDSAFKHLMLKLGDEYKKIDDKDVLYYSYKFNEPDLQGDIIAKDAFDEHLARMLGYSYFWYGDPNSTCKFEGLDKIINTGKIDV